MESHITVVFKCPTGSKLRRDLINCFKEEKPYKQAVIKALSLKNELQSKAVNNK